MWNIALDEVTGNATRSCVQTFSLRFPTVRLTESKEEKLPLRLKSIIGMLTANCSPDLSQILSRLCRQQTRYHVVWSRSQLSQTAAPAAVPFVRERPFVISIILEIPVFHYISLHSLTFINNYRYYKYKRSIEKLTFKFYFDFQNININIHIIYWDIQLEYYLYCNTAAVLQYY